MYYIKWIRAEEIPPARNGTRLISIFQPRSTPGMAYELGGGVREFVAERIYYVHDNNVPEKGSDPFVFITIGTAEVVFVGTASNKNNEKTIPTT